MTPNVRAYARASKMSGRRATLLGVAVGRGVTLLGERTHGALVGVEGEEEVAFDCAGDCDVCRCVDWLDA